MIFSHTPTTSVFLQDAACVYELLAGQTDCDPLCKVMRENQYFLRSSNTSSDNTTSIYCEITGNSQGTTTAAAAVSSRTTVSIHTTGSAATPVSPS